MKYLFLLSEKFYRLIEWEWNTLKNLRRTKRKNFFLRASFALLGANILVVVLWITISTLLINLFQSENAPFYIYKISFLIRFLPPIWLTWFLWIKRGGLKR